MGPTLRSVPRAGRPAYPTLAEVCARPSLVGPAVPERWARCEPVMAVVAFAGIGCQHPVATPPDAAVASASPDAPAAPAARARGRHMPSLMACVAVNPVEFESEPLVRSRAADAAATAAEGQAGTETTGREAEHRAMIDELLRASGLRFSADTKRARARVRTLGELVPDGAGGFKDPTLEVPLVLDAWDPRPRIGYELLGTELHSGRLVERLSAGVTGRGGEIVTWYRGQASGEAAPGGRRSPVVALFEASSTEDLRTQVLQFAAWLRDNGLGQ